MPSSSTATAAGVGLTRLKLDGRVLLKADIPVDAEWDFVRGACVLNLDRPAGVEVSSRGLLKLGPGEHRLTGLAVMDDAAAGRLARVFDQPVPNLGPAGDAALRPALSAPNLLAAPEPWPDQVIHALKIEGGGKDSAILLGCDDGRVIRSDRSGTARWQFPTNGPVRAVETVILRHGVRAVLAGSDDGCLYALDFETGKKLWAHRAEVYPETSLYPWWTLDGKAKVRSVLAADFDGDGEAEIAVGTGGMEVEMIEADGTPVWRQPVRYGLPARLLALTPPSGGPPSLLAGLDLLASQSGIFRFRGDGALESADSFPSGREGWDYTGVSAWALIEPPERETPLLAVGRSGAFNEIEFYDVPSGRPLGGTRVGDTVSGLVWMGGGMRPTAIAATEAAWVMAIRPDGRVTWSVPLPDAVARLWKTGDETVAAWCPSGDYFVLERSGRVQARGRASWAAAMLATSRN